jgi:hypothetical protein
VTHLAGLEAWGFSKVDKALVAEELPAEVLRHVLRDRLWIGGKLQDSSSELRSKAELNWWRSACGWVIPHNVFGWWNSKYDLANNRSMTKLALSRR